MKFLVIIISYLIGSISFGYIVGKNFKNIDIRQHGSGNSGATNGIRILGKKLGILIFLLDFLKAIVSIKLGVYLLGHEGFLLSSIFVVVGHNYPVFYKFKGGKGIATSLGVIFMMDFRVFILLLLVGLLIVKLTRYVSLASVSLSVLAPLALYGFGTRDKWELVTITILALMSIYQHRGNINRLINGEENKI